ncbi:MAG: hypothetical protein QOH70_3577 [Blastocatellia bacterium]|nr:hypothetical protein [Blastocatellia bacterium]
MDGRLDLSVVAERLRATTPQSTTARAAADEARLV